jgi:hypothetical protein
MVRRGQLVISPKCVRLLDDINDAVWDLQRKKFDQVSETWHYDALAALVYLCRTADLTLCPEPAIWTPPGRSPVPDGVSRVALPSGGDNRVRFQRRR